MPRRKLQVKKKNVSKGGQDLCMASLLKEIKAIEEEGKDRCMSAYDIFNCWEDHKWMSNGIYYLKNAVSEDPVGEFEPNTKVHCVSSQQCKFELVIIDFIGASIRLKTDQDSEWVSYPINVVLDIDDSDVSEGTDEEESSEGESSDSSSDEKEVKIDDIPLEDTDDEFI